MNTVFLPREVYWHQQTDIYAWCVEHFGEYDRYWPNPKTWSYWATFGSADFYFAKPEYATMFTLRWLK